MSHLEQQPTIGQSLAEKSSPSQRFLRGFSFIVRVVCKHSIPNSHANQIGAACVRTLLSKSVQVPETSPAGTSMFFNSCLLVAS